MKKLPWSSLFHAVNGEGSGIPYLSHREPRKALRMCFSGGDSKLQSQRASRRQTQTRRRFTDTPAAWARLHMRGRIKRLERRLLLSTPIERLEDGRVLKSCAPTLLFSAEKRLRRITGEQTSIRPDISYQELRLIYAFGKQAFSFTKGAHVEFILRQYDKSAATIKGCSTCADCEVKKKALMGSRVGQQLHGFTYAIPLIVRFS